MTTADENKAVARRVLEEVVGQGRVELIDDLVADDFVAEPPDGERGPAGYRHWITRFRQEFPDLSMSVEDQIAENDKVATRFSADATHSVEFLGVPPTGRRISATGIVIHQIRDGKLSNYWLEQDNLGILRQLTDASRSAKPPVSDQEA